MVKSNLIKQPHIAFVLIIPIILLLGFTKENQVLDINVKNTYYVVNVYSITQFIVEVLILKSLIYWLVSRWKRRQFRSWLSTFHTICSFIACIGIIISLQYSKIFDIYLFFYFLLLATILSFTLFVINIINIIFWSKN